MIQSIERAFALLEHIAARKNARLSELADATGLNRSTTHNILATLESLGYVEQLGRGRPYGLTSKFLGLVRSDVEREDALRLRLRPVLERVAAETGETTYLALASGSDYLCVDAIQSAEPLRLNIAPGHREPLFGTAIGYALLAADDALASRLARENPAAWSGAEEFVQDARARGFALDLEYAQAGVHCVAVPWGDRAAIGLAGPSTRLSRDRLEQIAAAVSSALAAT